MRARDRPLLVVEDARCRVAARAPGLEVLTGEAGGTFAAACCLGSSHALGGASPDELPTDECPVRAWLEPIWVATSSQGDREEYGARARLLPHGP